MKNEAENELKYSVIIVGDVRAGAWVYSKPALLEGLEVDQYIWGVIQSLSNAAPYDEVTIDAAANWKPVPPLSAANDQQDLGLLSYAARCCCC